MLILSRKVGQKITVGRDVTIVVVEIGSGKVRLGIEAPREVAVHRLEVAEAVASTRKEGDAR